jgi:hypothetical protein
VSEFILGLILGGYTGWWLCSRRKSDRTPRIYQVALSTRSAVYLHEFGTLDIPRAHAIASRIARGMPVRYKSLVGKGKLLRRSEWDRIIAGELVKRGMMVRHHDRTLTPSPQFYQACCKLAGIAHAQTRTGAQEE